MWNVIIVDDHPLMRRGISQLLSFEEEFNLVGEASNGTDAIALILQNEPDLVLLDLNMKGMSGLETLKALRLEGITCPIVILTVSDSSQDIRTLIKAGADGYLLKDTEPEALVSQLKQAIHGDKVYSEEIKRCLDENFKNSKLSSLTTRELEILHHVARGLRNRQVAEHLFISEATVKVHMKSLLKKLNVSSRVAATLLYLNEK